MSCNCGKNQPPKRPQNPYAQRPPMTVYNAPSNQMPPNQMPPNYAPPYPNHPYPY